MNRRRGRAWKIAGAALVALLAVAGAAAGWLLTRGWADVRSDLVKARAGDRALATRGRALLQQAARAHGLAAWQGHRSVELVATDLWATDGAGWWPERVQRFRAERLLGTFTSRVELLDGAGRGETWGLTGWAAYKVPAGGTEPEALADPAIEFYLPTLQYFDELPFRLSDATVILHGGSGRYHERPCERVFVTWGRPEPHGEHDQYDLWIDSETSLIQAARYTVREAAALSSPLMQPLMKAFAMGTIHFSDYRRVDGVMVPFVQTVTLGAPEKPEPPAKDAFFHKIVLEDVRFGAVPPDVFTTLPNSRTPGDRKP